MRESYIEAQLVRRVTEIGGRCWKLTGVTGQPDRLILWPDGTCSLVETKSPVGQLRPAQRIIHRALARIGHPVTVLSTPEQVRDYVESRDL